MESPHQRLQESFSLILTQRDQQAKGSARDAAAHAGYKWKTRSRLAFGIVKRPSVVPDRKQVLRLVEFHLPRH
jgi:hypothetical protein